MVTFLSLAVLRLVGAARAEDDVVAAIDARADEFAEAAGGTGIGIKGMMVAAKVLALTAVGFFQPELMERGGWVLYMRLCWGIGSRRWIIASREWPGGGFRIGPLAHSRNTSCVPPRTVSDFTIR